MVGSKRPDMPSDVVCVEFGHEHLSTIHDGVEPPDLDVVRRELDRLSDSGDYTVRLVIIDDTGEDISKQPVADYVDSLDVTPDAFCFETDFEPAFDELFERVIPDAGELHNDMRPAKAYSERDQGHYLYVGDGTELERCRLTDYRDTSEKTGYTSAFRCAAMTFAKLGLLETPRTLMPCDASVTFHRSDFFGSAPYDSANWLRSVIGSYGLLDYDPARVVKRPMTEPDDTEPEVVEP